MDNTAARENIVKFAAANGWAATAEEGDGCWLVRIVKGTPAATAPFADPAAGGAVYLITHETIGHGSDELGAVLMKAFFYSLGEIEPPPRAILLINGGVKLAVEGSPVLEYIASFAECGVKVLSCGTCLDYFQLRERLAAGGVTNMYTILAELSAGKAVTI